MKIILASSNAHKANEIQKSLSSLNIKIQLSSECSIVIPDSVEKYSTYKQNSWAKCSYVAKKLNDPSAIVLADDSGLEVNALNGEPGIYSARYSSSGEDSDNRKKLLQSLQSIPFQKRNCHFSCALCLWLNGEFHYFQGSVIGYIVNSEVGINGFGYDPIFFYPPLGKTFSEISTEQKEHFSHRGKALEKLNSFLKNIPKMGLEPTRG